MGCSSETGMNSNDNYITAVLEVKDYEEEDEIEMINSYDRIVRNTPDEAIEGEEENYNNETEIKDCTIYIDGKPIIPFSYTHKFTRGKYLIKYDFHHLLTKTDYMFCYCLNLTEIDLTHFNSSKVNNMSRMFFRLLNAVKIDVSNLNTA